ncbi:hypothetical protein VTL71DRAFT_11703 [Oculimacula yallundae]|uniref:Uncharacterized protein n=1 Tax=Oculimacula yallundae TaxID=86028 RepID=A0ABR4CQY5_9HELO
MQLFIHQIVDSGHQLYATTNREGLNWPFTFRLFLWPVAGTTAASKLFLEAESEDHNNMSHRWSQYWDPLGMLDSSRYDSAPKAHQSL